MGSYKAKIVLCGYYLQGLSRTHDNDKRPRGWKMIRIIIIINNIILCLFTFCRSGEKVQGNRDNGSGDGDGGGGGAR